MCTPYVFPSPIIERRLITGQRQHRKCAVCHPGLKDLDKKQSMNLVVIALNNGHIGKFTH